MAGPNLVPMLVASLLTLLVTTMYFTFEGSSGRQVDASTYLHATNTLVRSRPDTAPADLEARRVAYYSAPFLFPQLYRQARKVEELPEAMEYSSQTNEDRWLYAQIWSKLPKEQAIGRTFVEIGALDGRTYSNTWMFEKNLVSTSPTPIHRHWLDNTHAR
jgi:hypothetical protein